MSDPVVDLPTGFKQAPCQDDSVCNHRKRTNSVHDFRVRSVAVTASGIYFPDTLTSAAGIHFMNVLKRLGFEERAGQPTVHSSEPQRCTPQQFARVQRHLRLRACGWRWVWTL